MNYRIVHKTEYTYNEPIGLCHNIARLVPRSTNNQTCKSTTININPEPDVLNEYEDFFGNKVLYFAVQQEHLKLTVTVSSEIEKTNASAIFYSTLPWEGSRKELYEPTDEHIDARQYLPETLMTAISPEVTDYALQSFVPGRSFFDAAYDLMQRIYNDFEFEPGFTTVSTPVVEVLAQRKGVCQDFAHLAIACIRSVGLPARYVSGYIQTVPPQGTERLVGVDASHAWFSVFIPGSGWIDMDPTNNQIPADQHITIGWGRDYADITPLKGVILSSTPHTLAVSVDVKRIG